MKKNNNVPTIKWLNAISSLSLFTEKCGMSIDVTIFILAKSNLDQQIFNSKH